MTKKTRYTQFTAKSFDLVKENCCFIRGTHCCLFFTLWISMVDNISIKFVITTLPCSHCHHDSTMVAASMLASDSIKWALLLLRCSVLSQYKCFRKALDVAELCLFQNNQLSLSLWMWTDTVFEDMKCVFAVT